MSAFVTQEGQVLLLTDLLNGPTPTLTEYHLDLFGSSLTPSITTTRTNCVAAVVSFSGYGQKILTRSVSGSTWSIGAKGSGTTINAAGNAKATYLGQIQWTVTSGSPSPPQVYGHYWCDVTNTYSILAERWGTPIQLSYPSTLTLTPVLELGGMGG